MAHNTALAAALLLCLMTNVLAAGPSDPELPRACVSVDNACPSSAIICPRRPDGSIVCAFNTTTCPSDPLLDEVELICPAPEDRPNRPRACVSSDGSCPSIALPCARSDGSIACVFNTTTCPSDPTALDGLNKTCPSPEDRPNPDRPRACVSADGSCPSTAIPCPRSDGSMACVFNTTCPSDPTALDGLNKTCPSPNDRPNPDRPRACVSSDGTCPPAAIPCTRNDGSLVCAFNTAACPSDPAQLDDVELICPTPEDRPERPPAPENGPNPDRPRVCLLSAGNTCPASSTACLKGDGSGTVCIEGTSCPANPDVLNRVQLPCPTDDDNGTDPQDPRRALHRAMRL